jgi:DNA-binding response OmpR family regulator
MMVHNTSPPKVPGEGAATDRETIRCLLVDDEIEFTRVLTKRLNRRRISVDTAASGNQAIQALRQKDYDIVVLDLKLSDMDGIDILKIFKKMVPEMPVIMLTGHGCEIAAREGLRLGANDYLTKPCDFLQLVEIIRRVARCKDADNGNV